MLGYAILRLAVEPLRDPVSADVVGHVLPSAVYWCAAALALAGACLLGRRDGAARVSLSIGKGFAPFGTDDPMVRPFVRYPVNHHLSQILERGVAIAAGRAMPRPAIPAGAEFS